MAQDNIRNFRRGDQVFWMDGGVRFEGRLTKINRKTAKAEQTNDVDRFTKGGWGRGGRTKGGKGRTWTLGIRDDGSTCFGHTAKGMAELSDTSRGMMAARQEKKDALDAARVAMRVALRVGVSKAELQYDLDALRELKAK